MATKKTKTTKQSRPKATEKKERKPLPALSSDGAQQLKMIEDAGKQFVDAIESATAVPSSHIWRFRSAVNKRVTELMRARRTDKATRRRLTLERRLAKLQEELRELKSA